MSVLLGMTVPILVLFFVLRALPEQKRPWMED